LIWERKKPEVVCDEALNEICGDDFSLSLKPVFTHAVLLDGKINFLGPRYSFTIGLYLYDVLSVKL
jgi:hypothetical protein